MRCLPVVVVVGLMAVQAEGFLLTNGNLDDPGLHETDLAVGWTLVEPDVDVNNNPINSATFATFADHTTFGVPGGVGLWYRSFTGGLNADAPPTVNADLFQDVPGTPGVAYDLSAWFLMEANYSGLDPAAPTQTILALDFLDAGDGILATVDLDIDGVYDAVTAGFQQFSVNGVAPAGTASVRARSSMIDGVLSPANPQSAFVDDFVLVPEPAAAVLLLPALGLVRRRSRR